MNHSTIENLLRYADRTAAGPALPPSDLVDRVIRRARRRRMASAGIGVAAVVAAISVATTLFLPEPAEQPAGAGPGPIAQLQDDANYALAEAKMHELVVENLLARQRQRRGLARSKAMQARPDPVEQMDSHVEQAAFVIVTQADRKARQWNLTDSAASDYRRVIELFPRTRWADVARQRLAGIEG